jgi:SNF2 family DNA or RNA helicase
MAWVERYTEQGIRAQDPALVAQFERRIRALGFDRPDVLHGFTARDLAEDLTKSRLLLAYNMGLGKTRAAIAAAAARGTKHTLFVIPTKLIGEWEREFAALGLTDEMQVITQLSQVDGYRCPAGCGEVTGFVRVRDAAGEIRDVERSCEACGTRAVRVDRLARFNLIAMRTLWTIPSDSPHAGRAKKPEIRVTEPHPWKDNETVERVVARERNRMKRTFAYQLRRRCEFVVIDEAYGLSNPDSLQTRAVFMLRPRHKWLLTGTPVRGYPENILALLNWTLGTGSDRFPDYDSNRENSRARFLRNFGTRIARVRDNGTQYEKWVPKISNPERFQAMLAPVMRRRVNLEPEVARAIKMPAFSIMPEQVEPDPLLRGLYEGAVGDFVSWWADVRAANAADPDARIPQASLLAKLTLLSQLAAIPQAIAPDYQGVSSKQARIIELTRDAAARGRKTIIFTEFADAARWYAASPAFAGLDPVLITGSVSMTRGKRSGTSDRERRLAAFREGTSQVLIATTTCMAEGLNIPQAGTVLFDSFPWVPSVQQQAWSRVLRPAQTATPVEIHLVGIAGTIDDYLAAICALKRAAIGEGIDHETVEIDLDDIPDPHVYANALVEASGAVNAAFGAVAWIDRLKAQASTVANAA